MTQRELNNYFDHALLKSDATAEGIIAACKEAQDFEFFGLAVNSYWISLVRDSYEKRKFKIVGVAGFPLGATTTANKICEALENIKNGADEIDMVANIGLLTAKAYAKAEAEISEIRRAMPAEIPLKVIIAAPLIAPQIQIDATRIVVNAGAQFVKTATGFFGGTTEEIVKNIVSAARNEIPVKASGGIRTLEIAEKFIELGANRLGSSASVEIVKASRAGVQTRI